MLTFYSSPGGSSQYVTLHCGQVLAEAVGGLYGVAGEGEDIRAFEVSFTEVLHMVDADLFDNAISIVGSQWLDRNRERLRQDWT